MSKTGPRPPATVPDEIFRAAFRHSPALQSVVRANDGVFVQVNDAFLQKFGFAREQVIGRTPVELDFWVEKEKQRAWKQRLEAEGSVPGFEVLLRAVDGRVFTVLLSTHTVDIGGVRHYITAGVDISLRKEAEARLSSLYDAISAAVVVHDEHAVVQVNQAAVRLFGAKSSEDLLGGSPVRTSAAIQPDGEASEVAAQRHIARALAEGHHRFEWLARALDGREFPTEVTLTPLRLDGRPVMQAVVLDLTEHKRAESELQRALERERELSQLKSEFVSLVSHEFRTPLEVIMSSADNLERYHERLAPEQRAQLLRTVHKSVRRMAGMMEEVLVLGRLESERMPFSPRPLDLAALCRRICDELASATSRRCPIDLCIDGLVEPARGDESVLRHIFSNLLSNAIKYSPEGRQVEFMARRDGDDVVCRIKDEGCGIPPADQKRLFQAFHRGSNVGQVAGTGLGLLIVQRCVLLHGGTIEFESAEGQGTIFTVILPLFAQNPGRP